MPIWKIHDKTAQVGIYAIRLGATKQKAEFYMYRQ